SWCYTCGDNNLLVLIVSYHRNEVTRRQIPRVFLGPELRVQEELSRCRFSDSLEVLAQELLESLCVGELEHPLNCLHINSMGMWQCFGGCRRDLVGPSCEVV